ncbi:MAG: hypothetical protein ACYDCQ_11965, partial [Dehalococcoidia bacterium]
MRGQHWFRMLRLGTGLLIAGILASLAGMASVEAHFSGSKTCTAAGAAVSCTLTFVPLSTAVHTGLPPNDVVTITRTGNAQYVTATVATTGTGFTGVGSCTASIAPGAVQPTTITVTIGADGCHANDSSLVVTETLIAVAPGGGSLSQRVASAAYTAIAPLVHDGVFTATTPAGGPFTLPAVMATPTLTTAASAGVTISAAISDTATLAGGFAPTGTITFTAFGPANPTCAGAPAFTSAAIPVAGNGAYPSGNFTPIAPGTYLFVASYSGDVNNA